MGIVQGRGSVIAPQRKHNVIQPAALRGHMPRPKYGRLTLSEVHTKMVGMDWLGEGQGSAEAAEWTELGRFLYKPYAFAKGDWPEGT